MKRLWKCVRQALPRSGKLSLWLFKIILPVSLAVRLLDYYGAIAWLSEFMNPVFQLIGLQGKLAIVFITSIFLPLYGSIAVMASLAMTMREATILAVMCLVAHNLPVECAVVRKTGSSFLGMFFLRILTAFAIAVFLNNLLPADNRPFELLAQPTVYTSLTPLFTDWLQASGVLILTILVIVTVLMIIQRLLVEFGLIETLSRPLRPLMRIFGLPEGSPFLWIVGNVAGLAYGGAIMADMVEEGKLSLKDSNTVNYHLCISHSLIEDTLLFVALGINWFVIIGTRLLFAVLVVWGRRLFQSLALNKIA
ncbi:MAG: nucleoside recognition domain-containing protein [Prevotellaceae bacterium]|jgi:hypothetical protein|nr:nucleoside recognition domain-containing protein [Prevotellaceae bacterium]